MKTYLSEPNHKIFQPMFWLGVILFVLFHFSCSEKNLQNRVDDRSVDRFEDEGVDKTEERPEEKVDGETSPKPQPKEGVELVYDLESIQSIELTMTDEHWQLLQDTALMEEYVPGSVKYRGETMDNIGIRFKGAGGSLKRCFDNNGVRNSKCDKMSYKLKFGEYEQGKRWHGLKRINLHGMDQDKAFMRDILSYEAYRQNGIAAPLVSYMNLIINGENFGLYLAVEAIDSRFTRAKNRFPDGGVGNLYKEVWPDRYQEGYFRSALKSNRVSETSVQRFLDFVEGLQNTTPAAFKMFVEKWLGVDHWLKYLSISRLVDHWDGPFAWYCQVGGPCGNHNYYFYESSIENRLWVIPWDYDLAFVADNPLAHLDMPSWTTNNVDCDSRYPIFGVEMRPASCDSLLGLTKENLWPEFTAITTDLSKTTFETSRINARIDELAEFLDEAVKSDPIWSYDDWKNIYIPELKNLALTTKERVLNEI